MSVDEGTMKAGLLLETAQAQQALAESLASRLRAHIEGMDAVVRDQIRRTLVEELGALMAEADHTAQSLRRLGRSAFARQTLLASVVALVCAAGPAAILRASMPGAAELESLETRRARLQSNVAALERRGGAIDVRQCGPVPRLCVRIDRSAPSYGSQADFYVVAGR